MSYSTIPRITFLFGSGISIPAQILSTSQISDIIFKGKNIVRGTAEDYFFGAPQNFDWNIYADFPNRVKKFIGILISELKDYHKRQDKNINYEEVYYLLEFLLNNYYGNDGNPAFKYLLKEFEPRINKLLLPINSLIDNNLELNKLLGETKIYIKDLVTILLSKKAESFRGLNILREFIQYKNLQNIDIFTLNHDTVIEQFFASESVQFTDGFKKADEDYSFWEPNVFDMNSRIKLFKIHGSVNWHYFDEYSWNDRRICKVSPNIFWREPKRSIILIGSYNKPSKYIEGLYLELFYRFYKGLITNNQLIVSGYSFNDRGINNKIFDWLLTGDKKMIVIDPYAENLRDKLPQILYNDWGENKKIIPINNFIENVSCDEIFRLL